MRYSWNKNFSWFLLFLCCLLSTFHLYAQEDGFAKTIEGAPIYYRSFGTGQPLLIINGGPGMNSDGFADLAKKLSTIRRVIIYDQRGTGKSSLPQLNSVTITMELMVSDIEALRKYLHIEQWDILGHSFGGMLASYYATQHPSTIKKLILSSSGGIDLDLSGYVANAINSKLTPAEQAGVAEWTNRINQGDTSHYARLQRGLNLAPAYVYDRKFIPVIAERLTQGNSLINQLVWSDLRRMKFDCREQLSNFSQPVLIIQGKQDIVSAATAQKSHEAFKNSKLVFMEHCVHYGWLDNEPAYFKEITSFLQ